MKAKYDTIGTGYNQTRKADPRLLQNLIRLLNPSEVGTYLDIGCGTGNYTCKLQKRGFKFIGIDPSGKMLDIAKSRNPKIDWRTGTAENTGLSDQSVDGIIATLTVHHWRDLEKAFAELFRIIKPGGLIVIFTSTPRQMKGYWLNHYFPKMLQDSIDQMPAYEDVECTMSSAGFKIKSTEKYFIQPDLQDKFLYCGKHDPELYFNENIRQGISSFSALANREEVERGLTRLRQDIDYNKIGEIMASYKNELGDYLYIIGENR